MNAFISRIGLPILITFCLCAAAYGETKVSGPQMVINERSFDFKNVKEGATVQHAFQVLNTGDQPLRIKQVKPT